MPADATVTSIEGSAIEKLEQGSRTIQVGDFLTKGVIIVLNDDARIEFSGESGSRFLYVDGELEAPSEISSDSISQDAQEQSDQDIGQIIEAIQSGQDPTLNEDNATAAGTSANSLGGHSFISLSRIGNETISSAGFNTSALTQAIRDTQDREAIFQQIDTAIPSSPTIVITEDINNDSYINNTELVGNIGIIVLLGVGTEVGDFLVVTDQDGNELFNGTVTQDMLDDGVPVTMTAPATGTTITVTATVTDPAGNTANGSDSATLDYGD
ncbi:retention module-containing protein, partial [Grimontia marina]|uniref:retention module-containing protein n=1 Tax=Grimontia marina TaxID=646534 RepID=UPI000AA7232F